MQEKGNFYSSHYHSEGKIFVLRVSSPWNNFSTEKVTENLIKIEMLKFFHMLVQFILIYIKWKKLKYCKLFTLFPRSILIYFPFPILIYFVLNNRLNENQFQNVWRTIFHNLIFFHSFHFVAINFFLLYCQMFLGVSRIFCHS